MGARSLLKKALPAIISGTGLGSVMARRYRGRGVIFMLHSVVDGAGFYPDAGLRCPGDRLAQVLGWLRESGVELVSLDEAVTRLAAPAGTPFAAFTFDDGYDDTLTRALPIMEKFGTPFTVYVTTGMITREIDAWWLGLAALVRANDRVELDDLGVSFDCRDAAGKVAALSAMESLVRRDYRALAPVKAAIKAGGIDSAALVDAEALSMEGLRRLARHPLVTIGGHTVTHGSLAQAPAEAVREEMAANRSFLQDALDAPIDHFAYPFGNAEACGDREAGIAAGVGFRSAVTTRRGSIFPAHLRHLHALPREPLSGADTRASVRCKMNGVYRALFSRWGDPVAVM